MAEGYRQERIRTICVRFSNRMEDVKAVNRGARATEASSEVVDGAHENDRPHPGRIRDGAINWSIIVLLLGTLFVPVTVLVLMTATDEERQPDSPASVSSSQETVINLEEPNYDKLIRKNLESVEGVAPRYSELAIYLNAELLDIVKADSRGRFSTERHTLPERSSRLAALPTEIDPSTLTILYLQNGFREQWIVGRPAEPDAPFLASIAVHDDTLHAYGSTEPDSEVEICQGPCAGENVILTARSDKEGSFRTASSSVNTLTGTLASLSARLRYIEDKDWFDPSPLEPATVELSPTAATPQIFQRAISMTLSPTSADLAFEVQMPAGYKVYQNLVKGDISELEFVEYIFGEVSVNTFLDPRRLVWRQEKSQQSQRVRVVIESNPLPYLIPGDTATFVTIDTDDLFDWGIPFYNARDRIAVTLKGTELLQSNLLPTESTENRVVWVGALTESDTILSLWASRSRQGVAHPIHRFRLLSELTALLEDIVKKRIPGPIGETYEGLVVGLLPDRAPDPVRAQAYDFFRALYLADPLMNPGDTRDSFHTFLKELPGRVPESTGNLLFGARWLIPSFLLLWVVRAPGKKPGFSDADRARLVLIGWGTAILVFLCLDWWPLLEQVLELSRHDFIRWLVTALAMFLLLIVPCARLAAWGAVASGTLRSKPDKSKALAPSQEGKTQTNEWLRRIFIAALLVTLVLFVVCLTRFLDTLLPLLPDAGVSILLTALLLLSFAALAYLATRSDSDEGQRLRKSFLWLFLGILVIAPSSIPIQALSLLTQLPGSTGVVTMAPALLRPVLPAVLLLGLAMTLYRVQDRKTWQELTPFESRSGKVLFVVFAVGLSPAWSFVPISLILSWFLYDRIVRDRPELEEHATAFSKKKRANAIDAWLASSRQRRLRRAPEDDPQEQPRDDNAGDSEKQAAARENRFTIRGLTNCFMNLIISDRRKGEHQESASETQDGDDPKDIPSDLAFGFGLGETRWDNARQALTWGVTLLAALLLLQVWPLFTAEFRTVLPFPFLVIGVRLGVFVSQYLAMALFLGYLFPNIKGQTGLAKSALVAGCVILASLPARLILVSSSTDLVALLVWAGTVLSFNLLIGLIAFDLKTLFHFGYGRDRVTDLFSFSEAAGLLIGSGIPFVTTVVTAVVGDLDKLVSAILKTAFPAVTLTEAKSELLQVLLELAKRIAGS